MKVGETNPRPRSLRWQPDKSLLLTFSRQILDEIYSLIEEDEKALIPLEQRHQLSVKSRGNCACAFMGTCLRAFFARSRALG